MQAIEATRRIAIESLGGFASKRCPLFLHRFFIRDHAADRFARWLDDLGALSHRVAEQR